MMLNNSSLETASDNAVKYSKVSSMADLKKVYTPAAASYGYASYGPVPMASLSLVGGPMPPVAMHMRSAAAPGAIPHPMAMDASATADTYSIAKEEISYGQSERLTFIYLLALIKTYLIDIYFDLGWSKKH